MLSQYVYYTLQRALSLFGWTVKRRRARGRTCGKVGCDMGRARWLGGRAGWRTRGRAGERFLWHTVRTSNSQCNVFWTALSRAVRRADARACGWGGACDADMSGGRWAGRAGWWAGWVGAGGRGWRSLRRSLLPIFVRASVLSHALGRPPRPRASPAHPSPTYLPPTYLPPTYLPRTPVPPPQQTAALQPEVLHLPRTYRPLTCHPPRLRPLTCHRPTCHQHHPLKPPATTITIHYHHPPSATTIPHPLPPSTTTTIHRPLPPQYQ